MKHSIETNRSQSHFDQSKHLADLVPDFEPHLRLTVRRLFKPTQGSYSIMIMQMFVNGHRCRLHVVKCTDSHSYNFDSTRGSRTSPRKAADSQRVHREIRAVKATMRTKRQDGEISANLRRTHTHTLSRQTLTLLSQTLTLYPAAIRGNICNSEKFVSNRIRSFFLGLNTDVGGGVGRKRGSHFRALAT